MRLYRLAYRSLLPPLVLLALLLLIWELYARTVVGTIAGGEQLLPAPSQIAGALLANTQNLAPHTRQTLLETVLGFTLALVVGLGFAIVIDSSHLLRQAVYPLLVISQTIPVLAIAPVLVLWFGFGLAPKILIIALYCFFPISVAGARGFQSADPELVKLFRTFGASAWDIFRKVRLPGAMPSLFSGIRIAITYSVTGAIWGEYVGASQGLWIFIQNSQHAFQIRQVFAAIGVVTAMSIALFLLTVLIERLAIPWYFAERKGESIAWRDLSLLDPRGGKTGHEK